MVFITVLTPVEEDRGRVEVESGREDTGSDTDMGCRMIGWEEDGWLTGRCITDDLGLAATGGGGGDNGFLICWIMRVVLRGGAGAGSARGRMKRTPPPVVTICNRLFTSSGAELTCKE